MIPDAYYENIHEIDYSKLKKIGIKNIFFDIDNTIIPYYEKEIDKETVKLFKKLKKDFKIFLFSNSPRKRVLKFSNILNVDAYYLSMKPLKKSYKKIMKVFHKDECIFIGDQFMTDVYGAKRNKLRVIFVNKLKDKEPLSTRFWRVIERIFIKKYSKIGVFNINDYYDRLRSI